MCTCAYIHITILYTRFQLTSYRFTSFRDISWSTSKSDLCLLWSGTVASMTTSGWSKSLLTSDSNLWLKSSIFPSREQQPLQMSANKRCTSQPLAGRWVLYRHRRAGAIDMRLGESLHITPTSLLHQWCYRRLGGRSPI